MNKRDFIQAYVISAINGSAVERGAVTIQDLLDEALEAWRSIEELHPAEEVALSSARARMRKEAQD